MVVEYDSPRGHVVCIVAEQSVIKCSQIIEKMENQVADIHQEERS